MVPSTSHRIDAIIGPAGSVIALRHRLERDRRNSLRLSGAPEGLETRLAQRSRSLSGRDQRLTRVELARIPAKGSAHGAGHRQTNICVDIHLAHAGADSALDLLDRNTVGLLDVAAVFANDGQPLLRYAGGAVHHQVGIRDRRM